MSLFFEYFRKALRRCVIKVSLEVILIEAEILCFFMGIMVDPCKKPCKFEAVGLLVLWPWVVIIAQSYLLLLSLSV